MAEIPSAELIQLVSAVRRQTSATLASAIITAAGKPYSIQQALEIMRDIENALHPSPNSGHYQDWAKTKEERLNKVHSAAT